MTESGQTAERTGTADLSPAVLAVAALGIASVALPEPAGPVVATVLGLATAVALAALAALRGRASLPRAARIPVALLAALAGWLTVCALLAVEPRVSLFGIVAQHDGALLWIVAAACAWGAALLARPRDLRSLTMALALLGAVLSAGAIADAAGLLDSTGRFSTEASGWLASSIALGQVLLVCGGCSVAWLAFERSAPARIAAAACAGLCAVALVLSQTRAAWAAALVAAVAIAALRRAGARTRRIFALALTALALVTVAVLPLVLHAGPGGRPPYWLSTVLTTRTEMWTAAVTVAPERLVAGFGPDRFSAWSTWSAPTLQDLDATAAYDPHDVLLYWLLAGGLPALALGLAAVAAWLDALLRETAGRGGPAAAILTGTLLAWGLSLRASWVEPIAAVLAVLLAGTLIGASAPRGPDAAPSRRWPAAAAAAALALLLAAAAYPTALEVRWYARRTEQTGSAEEMERAFAAWPDPAYARAAMAARLGPGTREGISAARVLARRLSPQLRYDAGAASLAANAHRAWSKLTAEDTRAEYFAAIDAGKSGSPNSGLWDLMAAFEAQRARAPAAARGQVVAARALGRAVRERRPDGLVRARRRAVARPRPTPGRPAARCAPRPR